METSKTSHHTRTSTSASALIADPAEDILRRAGIQMLGLLDLAAALARIPAARQALLRFAPDAASLLEPIPVVEGAPDQAPKTIAERIDFVLRDLAETDVPEEMSLRAFVHLIGDDMRAAHPRRSWAEIAEILRKVGFAGATADNVRQSVKSAPVGPVVPPQDQPVASAADEAPPSSPGQTERVMPLAGMPTVPGPAEGDPRSVPTPVPENVPAAPAMANEPQTRPIFRSDAPGPRPQFGSDRGGMPDQRPVASAQAAGPRLPDVGQPTGAPPRPAAPVVQPQPPRPAFTGAPDPRSGPMVNPPSGAAPRPVSDLGHHHTAQRGSMPAPASAPPVRPTAPAPLPPGQPTEGSARPFPSPPPPPRPTDAATRTDRLSDHAIQPPYRSMSASQPIPDKLPAPPPPDDEDDDTFGGWDHLPRR